MRKYILIIVLVILAVYANSAFNGFVWDDEFLILKNPSIMSWNYAWIHFAIDLYHSFSNYYRPIQMITYMADFSLWRLNPFGYHLTNIFLHIAACVLLFLFILMIAKDKRAAAIGAVLYAVHPANTGAVAYIAGRADILAAIFTLLSFMSLYAHFKSQTTKEAALYYAASLVLFLAALLSKEITIITPVLILVYCLFFIDDAQVEKSRKSIKFNYLSGFISITGVYLILRVYALNFQEIGLFESSQSLYLRFLTFLKALVQYFGIIFFPAGLHMERSISYAASFRDSAVLYSAAGMLITMWVAARIKKVSKEAFFGLLFFFIALLPVSTVFPMASNMAEHWLYIPLMGIALSAGAMGIYLWDKRTRLRPLLAFLFTAYFIFFSHQTVDRNFDWRDNFTIYNHTMKYTPSSIKMLNNLGNLYHDKKDLKRAAEFHLKAVKVNPGEHRTRVNLGIDYEDMGLPDEALKQYKLSRLLRPDYALAYLREGSVYKKRGDIDKAAACYKLAAQYDEFNMDAWNKLGNVYFDKGMYEESKNAYKKALEIDPYAAGAHNNLANALSGLGLNEQAAEEYKKAIDIDPENAEYLFNLGTECGKQGRYDEAIKALKEAHGLRPKHAATLINLGAAYFHKKDFLSAEKEWEKVLRIDSQNEIAKDYLKRIK